MKLKVRHALLYGKLKYKSAFSETYAFLFLFFFYCREYIKNMASNVTECTGNFPKRQDKYVRRSSVNDSLNDKYENLSVNLATKEKLIKLLGEKNSSLYSENQQLKKDKRKIEKEKDEALSR
jgi:hypothetical protein